MNEAKRFLGAKTNRLLAACFAAVLTEVSVATAETTNLFPTVEAQICEGRIDVNSYPVRVWAEWRIEWPETVSCTCTQSLDRIRRLMIDDCFDSLMGDSGRQASQLHSSLNEGLQLVFSRAYSKLEVASGADRPPMHDFSFMAKLKIRFADAGYIGYVLEGYENEGGNGCHAYVIARVLSLATGQAVSEADFMTASGFAAFPKTLFERISQTEDVRGLVIGTEDGAKGALGNFVVEPDGIRWWVPPYAVVAGAAGVQNTLVTWAELKPFLKPGVEHEFKAVYPEAAL